MATPSQPHAPAAAGSSNAAVAAAADRAVRHNRASKPKVKTGCANCKQRRIKCDEKRPICSQCSKSKKICGGYPPPPRGARPYGEIRIAPKPGPVLAAAPSASAPALAPPAPTIPVPAFQPQPVLRPLHQAPPRPPQPRAPQMPQPQPFPLQLQPQQQQQQQQPFPVQISSRRAQKLQQRRNQQAQAQDQTRAQGQVYGAGFALVPATAVAAAAAAAAAPPLLYHPSMCLPFSQQEGLYFQLFRTQTANELSGFFDNVFWSHSVLVECHSEAAIRHAVVALGALYKTLEKTTESPPNSPSADPYDTRDSAYSHWEVALKQYSQACRACRDLANVSTQDVRTQRIGLMASVLLACFDSFIGHHKQAIVQIQTGLALLERLRADRRQSRALQGAAQARHGFLPAPAAPEPVEDELTQMFTRLAIQAKSYDMAFHFPQPYVIRLLPPAPATDAGTSMGTGTAASEPSDTPSPSSPPASSDVGSPVSTHQDPIPAQFATLREARLAWDTLCEHIFRFMELMFQYAQGPPNLLPESMTFFGRDFKTRIEAWSNAFQPLLVGRANPGVSSQEKAGIAVLKMFQIMGQILFLMTFSDSEMQFDAFQPQFKAIVDLASEVVGDEERRAAAARCPDPTRCVHHFHNAQGRGAYHKGVHGGFGGGGGAQPSHIKASFSADLGIVPPLYVVATKSRDRVLRRQAIQLLRSSARREGMWDSELVARIGMWVVEIEEEGEEAAFLAQLQRAGSMSSSVGGSVGGSVSGSVSGGSIGGDPRLSPSPPASYFPPQAGRGRSVDFGEIPLGPGGNARWDARRSSTSPSSRGSSFSMRSAASPSTAAPSTATLMPLLDPNLPHYMQVPWPVPAERRVLVKACEFDLREHTATLKCGTRGLAADALDNKTRITHIRW